MKKVLMTLVACFMLLPLASKAEAQDAFHEGTSFINLGVGFNDNYKKFPPISASYEYGIKGNLWDAHSTLGLGAYTAFGASNNWNAFVIGPRIALHYGFVPKLDTYVSLMLGYINVSYDADVVVSQDSGFDWGAHLGLRYLFTPNVGGFMELGYGISYVNLGISFRL